MPAIAYKYIIIIYTLLYYIPTASLVQNTTELILSLYVDIITSTIMYYATY